MNPDTTAFDELLEAVEHLSAEEQADLVDLIQRRLAEQGRRRVVAEMREARSQFQQGAAKPASVDDLILVRSAREASRWIHSAAFITAAKRYVKKQPQSLAAIRETLIQLENRRVRSRRLRNAQAQRRSGRLMGVQRPVTTCGSFLILFSTQVPRLFCNGRSAHTTKFTGSNLPLLPTLRRRIPRRFRLQISLLVVPVSLLLDVLSLFAAPPSLLADAAAAVSVFGGDCLSLSAFADFL